MTSCTENLERRLAEAEAEITALTGMIDTTRRVVKAESFAVETDGASPQVIAAPEGNLILGTEGSWRVVDALTEVESHTGDTVETALWEGTVPADSMGPNGILRIGLLAKPHAGSTFRVYFGQIAAANKIGNWFHAATDFLVGSRPLFVWNKNSAAAQGGEDPDANLQLHLHYVASGSPQIMTEDTTSDVSVYCTVQNAANGDESYLYFAALEACYRP